MATKSTNADRPAALPSRTHARPAPHRPDPTDAPHKSTPRPAAEPQVTKTPEAHTLATPDAPAGLDVRRRRRPEPTMQLSSRVSVQVRDLLDDHLDATGARRGDLRKVLERVITGYWANGNVSEDDALAAVSSLEGPSEPTVQLASRVAVSVRQIIDAAVSRTGLSLREAVEAALVAELTK